jgi:hypothetical protein
MHGHFKALTDYVRKLHKERHKGSLAFFTGMLFFSVFLMLMLGNYAYYQAEMVCPNQFAEPPSDIIAYLWAMITIFFDPCSGLPAWIYIFIFMPIGAAIVVYLTPFIGGD